MVLSLIAGLALALAAALAQPVRRSRRRRRVGRRLPQPAADLPDPLPVPRSRRAPWRDAWEDVVPGLVPRGAAVGLRARRPVRPRPLQLRGAGGDHARRHPLAAARAGRGGGRARADLPAVDAARDPAPGPAADGAGDRLAAHHAQQGHDARLHHRHPGGRAPRAGSVTARRNPSSAAGAGADPRRCSSSSALLFIIVNLLLSRLSRRLEIRERQRTGSTPKVDVRGLEEQVA